MTALSDKIISDTWVNATWGEYLSIIDELDQQNFPYALQLSRENDLTGAGQWLLEQFRG